MFSPVPLKSAFNQYEAIGGKGQTVSHYDSTLEATINFKISKRHYNGLSDVIEVKKTQ